MDDRLRLEHVFIDPEKYHALENPDYGTLYFLTNGELYRGSILYGTQVAVIDNSSIPLKGQINRIYYNSDTNSLSIWKNDKWIKITPKTANKISIADPDPDNINDDLVTVDSLKDYITKLIDTGKVLSSSAGAVSNIPISNIKTRNSIFVNHDIGSYHTGDIINAGTSVDDIIENLFTVRALTKYELPRLTISPSTFETEVGTEHTFIFDLLYDSGDGGDVTSISIYRGTNKQYTEPLFSSKYLISQYTISTPDIIKESEELNYKFIVNYEDGPLKNDNLGNLQEEGSIKKGQVETTFNCVGKRCSWYESSAEDIDIMTSEDIRQLKHSMLDMKKNSTFSIDVNIGDKSVVIAYPEILGDIKSINSDTLHMDITSIFEKTNVMVAGANGYRSISYNVYKYTPNIPFVSKDTFNVVI